MFSTLKEADAVKSMEVHLRQGQRFRVARHVPWQAQDRGNTLEARAKALRVTGHRTKIDLRDADYSLQF